VAVKNFILRGRPGSGKSTAVNIVRKILGEAGLAVAGIVTPELREGGSRVGFEVVDVATGRRSTFARVGMPSSLRVSKYGVSVELFDRVAVPALESALGADVAIVDEIGKMELFSERFRSLVVRLMDSSVPVVGTAPFYDLPFLREILRRGDVRVVWVRRGQAGKMARSLADEVLRIVRGRSGLTS